MRRNDGREERTSEAACSSAARATRRRPPRRTRRSRQRPHAESARCNRPRRAPRGEPEPPPQKSGGRAPHRRIGCGGTAGARSAQTAPCAAASREQRDGGRFERRDDPVSGRTHRARAVTNNDVHRAESSSRRCRIAAAERHTAAVEAAGWRARGAHEKAMTPSAAARRERAPSPTTMRTSLRVRAAAVEERRPSATPPHRMRRHGGREVHTSDAACSGTAKAARRRPPRRMRRPRRRPHAESARRHRPRRAPR